jgi:hypothetical protein
LSLAWLGHANADRDLRDEHLLPRMLSLRG